MTEPLPARHRFVNTLAFEVCILLIGIIGATLTVLHFAGMAPWNHNVKNEQPANDAPLAEKALDESSGKDGFDRGTEAYKNKDFELAIACFTEAIQFAEANGLHAQLVNAYASRSGCFLAKEDYDKAIADCNHAIKLDPGGSRAYFSRGSVYGVKGEDDKAIADFSEAIRLNPRYARAYSSRGLAHEAKHEYKSAVADYTEAIRLNPQHPRYYHDRARIYRALGDDKNATNDERRVKDLSK